MVCLAGKGQAAWPTREGLTVMPTFEARQSDFAAITTRFLQAMPAWQTLGLSIRDLSPGCADIEMVVQPSVTYDGRHVQGGLVGALLDIAGGAAAFTLVGAGHAVVTLGFETHHLGPPGGALLLARGRVVKPGRTQAVSLVEIDAVAQDGTARLCATGHVTSCWVPLP